LRIPVGWRTPVCKREQIHLTEVEIHFCASSFSEFLFRFWIESEIWYAADEKNGGQITALENEYVNSLAN
jgi:hypothetical protein